MFFNSPKIRLTILFQLKPTYPERILVRESILRPSSPSKRSTPALFSSTIEFELFEEELLEKFSWTTLDFIRFWIHFNVTSRTFSLSSLKRSNKFSLGSSTSTQCSMTNYNKSGRTSIILSMVLITAFLTLQLASSAPWLSS